MDWGATGRCLRWVGCYFIEGIGKILIGLSERCSIRSHRKAYQNFSVA